MTPERLTECLAIIGWKRLALARKLGAQQTVVEQWHKGRARIPEAEAAWIERLAAFHVANPPPPHQDQRKVPRGPVDPQRLERLQALLRAGKTFDAAAQEMGEKPKALRTFAARHGVSAKRLRAGDQVPTAPIKS